MSIKIMTQVWSRLNCGGGELLLALAIADIANDDGERIYPSVEKLAIKSRQGHRTVQRQLKEFRAKGWLIVVRGEKGGRNMSPSHILFLARIEDYIRSSGPETMRAGLPTSTLKV